MQTIDYFARILGTLALSISLITFIISYRRDAHRIHLSATPAAELDCEVLGIFNDSSNTLGVIAVGCISPSGLITWIERVGEYISNKWVRYPIKIEGRSLSSLVFVHGRHLPNRGKPYGYCVRLESGRIFVKVDSLPLAVAWKFRLWSLASRIFPGWLGLPKHMQPKLHQQ